MNPKGPLFKLKGPYWIFLRPVRRCGRIAAMYEDEDIITKLPTNALNAVVLPT